MTIDQFRERMATDEPIIGGSDLHMQFHQFSQEALRITAEINGSYHAPEELRRLLSELWAINVPESFGMFPPFYTDCGKNTHVGERVFINMGCKFQDQGGQSHPRPGAKGRHDSQTYSYRQASVARRERDHFAGCHHRRKCHRGCWSSGHQGCSA